MTVPITVAIPVGPKPHHREYLDELIFSIEEQTIRPEEVLIINDGGERILHDAVGIPKSDRPWIKEYILPWNCGCVAGWNCAVGLARNEHVLLCGADDKLFPECCKRLWQSWEQHQELYGYYYLGVRYNGTDSKWDVIAFVKGY